MPSTYLTFRENISQGPSTLQKNSPPKSTWAKAFLVHDRPQERQQIYNTIYKFYIKHIPVIAAYKKIYFFKTTNTDIIAIWQVWKSKSYTLMLSVGSYWVHAIEYAEKYLFQKKQNNVYDSTT